MANNISQKEIKQIDERVQRVKKHLAKSTSAWLDIAYEFNLARAMLSRLAYEKFVNDTGITHHVAAKLVKIGKSNALRADQNQELIAVAEGWTVLYELAKLDDNKLQSLFKKLRSNLSEKLTRKLVLEHAGKKPENQRSIIIAAIEIDQTQLSKVSDVRFANLLNELTSLEGIINSTNSGFHLNQRSTAIKKVENQAIANSNSAVMNIAA